MTNNEDVTIKELANELDVAYITALTYVHRGQVKGIRKGGQWKISREEVTRFKKEGNHPEYDPSAWAKEEQQ